MTGLVSAVIPTYNYGRFIARAVTSVLGQSYQAVECIVVDDGSTDDTAEVLRGFGRDVTVVRQTHRGVSAARNAAIAVARGEYIALLDGDDEWHPDKVATQVRRLAAAPDLGCVGSGLVHVAANGRRDVISGRRNTLDRRRVLRDVALRRYWIGGSGSGAVMRRAALDRVGPFDEQLAAAEDWDMWMRFAATTPIDNVEDVLVSIHRHGTGIFRDAALVERNQWHAYRKAVARWPDVLTTIVRRRMRAMILADAGCELAGQPVSALGYYARSLAAWPFSYRRSREAAALAARALLGGRSPEEQHDLA